MRFAIFLLLSGLAFGQLDTNTLTITASRNVSVAPDQVLYNVMVSTDPAATLDAVSGRLAGAGIVPANLIAIQNSQPSLLNWIFQFASPFSKMKDISAALTKARQDVSA